jgi:hypothetical protein
MAKNLFGGTVPGPGVKSFLGTQGASRSQLPGSGGSGGGSGGCGGGFTSLMLISAGGLLENAGLAINPAVLDNITKLTNGNPITDTLTQIKAGSFSNITGGSFSEAIQAAIGSAGANFPSLLNTIPSGFSSSIIDFANETGFNFPNATSLTSALTQQANNILGADLGVFAQHISSAENFIASNNEFITSTLNAQSGLLNTFQGFAPQLTGSFSDISASFPTFASELGNIGNVIDFKNLGSFGNPAQLLATVQAQTGGLPNFIETSLKKSGFSPAKFNDILKQSGNLNSILQTRVKDLGLANLSTADVNKSFGKLSFDVLGQINEQVAPGAIASFQQIIGSNIANITNGQQFLDLKKTFPRTAATLTSHARNASGENAANTLKGIFI